ncbi:MAG: NAD(P)/FAD-dependent oxidoreductase [Myxococcota bacterium]
MNAAALTILVAGLLLVGLAVEPDDEAPPADTSAVEAVEPGDRGARLAVRGPDGEPARVRAPFVVNAAGLGADRVAALAGVDPDAAGWRQHWCKGRYFALTAEAPRPRTALVYPVPGEAGLGIHLTTDLGGRVVAGPDAAYVDRLDYAVAPEAAHVFADAVARYLPGLRPEHLTPDYAGVRPKLQGPGDGFRDFVVEERPPGVVHLLGLESPGLTAALALGELVAGRAG